MPQIKTPAAGIAAALLACAAAAPLVIRSEGWLLTARPDPVGIPTACAGVTQSVTNGKQFSEADCVQLTAQAMLRHELAIAPCEPAALSTDTRAAFLSFAYNVGAGAFCSSTLSKKALAGDLPGACAELDRWTYAGGRQQPGLVTRRAAERQLCEQGLKEAAQ